MTENARWSNLTVRIVTSLLILPPVLALIALGSPAMLAGAAVVLCGLAGYEFATMAVDREFAAHRFFISGMCAVTASAVVASIRSSAAPLALLISLAPLFFALFMFTSKEPTAAFRNGAFSLAGTLYTGGLFGALGLIPFAADGQGRWWVLLLVASTVMNDTCAYAAGRTLGRHKLHPVLSPNKTWEGSAGGLMGSLAAVLVVRQLFLPEVSLPAMGGLGLFLGAVSQVGDLMESFIKRSFHVKDAGHILPGHGGLLDRLDGLILGAPVVLLFTMV